METDDERKMKLYEAHSEEGTKLFGKRWEMANVGWSSGDDFICTKVYGDESNATKVLTSCYDDDNKIVHQEEEYNL